MDQNGHTHVLAQENSIGKSDTPKLVKTTGNRMVNNTELECDSHIVNLCVLNTGGTIGMRIRGGSRCTALNLLYMV